MNPNRPKKGGPERAAIRRQELIGLLDDDVLHAGVGRRFCLPEWVVVTAEKKAYSITRQPDSRLPFPAACRPRRRFHLRPSRPPLCWASRQVALAKP